MLGGSARRSTSTSPFRPNDGHNVLVSCIFPRTPIGHGRAGLRSLVPRRLTVCWSSSSARRSNSWASPPAFGMTCRPPSVQRTSLRAADQDVAHRAPRSPATAFSGNFHARAGDRCPDRHGDARALADRDHHEHLRPRHAGDTTGRGRPHGRDAQRCEVSDVRVDSMDPEVMISAPRACALPVKPDKRSPLGSARRGDFVLRMVGWPTGIEPVTVGSTIRCSAD